MLCIGNWQRKHTRNAKGWLIFTAADCAPIMFIWSRIMNGTINSKWQSKWAQVIPLHSDLSQLKHVCTYSNWAAETENHKQAANQMEMGLECPH